LTIDPECIHNVNTVIRIREVVFPPDVEEKLWTQHKLTIWEVLQVVHDPEGEQPRWDVDPEHGGRVILRGQTRGTRPRLIYVSLGPVDLDEGTWVCITAFAPENEEYGADEER
jgi:hypothetical protein